MKRSAYTLIELLVVIIVIMAMLSIGVPLIGNAMQKAEITKTKALLEKINTAIQNYHATFGFYPSVLSYGALGQVHVTRNGGRVDPFLPFETSNVFNPGLPQDDWVYKDSWGNPFIFYHLGLVARESTAALDWNEARPNEGGWVPLVEYQMLIGADVTYNPGDGSANNSNYQTYWEQKDKIHYLVEPRSVDWNGEDKDVPKLDPLPLDRDKRLRHVLVPGFLLWSRGPSGTTGLHLGGVRVYMDKGVPKNYKQEATTDDIGNWGSGREVGI